MFMDKKNILIPALVFVLFAALYVMITLMAKNDMIFKSVWDIGHYLSIAEDGYEVYPCDPKIHYPMGDICGNVGWFPAWPMAVKILSFGQANFGIRVLPYLFGFMGFLFFYNLLAKLANQKAALLGLLALACSPTAFYFLTGFPYSFMLVLIVAYLYYLYEPKAPGRKYILPLLAVLISLCYPSAFLTAIIPFAMLINHYRKLAIFPGVVKIVKDLIYYIAPFALGPLLLSIYFYFKFDDFLLILHFQEKYDRHWGFPLGVIWQSLMHFKFTTDAHFMQIAHTYYTANFIILWYALIFFIFPPYRTKPELVIFVLLLFLFSPATGSVFSIWRHYVLLFPAVIMIACSPRPRWLKLVYIAFGLFLALAIYYPIFMKSYLV
jgi:hypothetical protein